MNNGAITVPGFLGLSITTTELRTWHACIRFMLGAIRDALDELAGAAVTAATPQVTPQVKRLLAACEGELSRAELQERLGLADPKHFRASYLLPALDAGLIEMTIPDKPRSSAQRYRLTAAGRHG